jgi:glucokinase
MLALPARGRSPRRARRRAVALVIGGDVGGTKTRLCLFEVEGEALQARAERTFSSPGYPALDDIVRDFLALTGARAELACFGIAGPVAGRTARTTNLAWRISAEGDRARLRHPAGAADQRPRGDRLGDRRSRRR